jgi:hypothetical protein
LIEHEGLSTDQAEQLRKLVDKTKKSKT